MAAAPTGIADFEGRWRLDRRISDLRDGGLNWLTGEAVLASGVWEEHGMLRLSGGPPQAAARRYIWTETEGGVAVAFADGRPFHVLPLGTRAAEVRHDCAPDLYLGRYDFARWPDWTLEWRVTGPRKDYVSLTRFSRGMGAPAT